MEMKNNEIMGSLRDQIATRHVWRTQAQFSKFTVFLLANLASLLQMVEAGVARAVQRTITKKCQLENVKGEGQLATREVVAFSVNHNGAQNGGEQFGTVVVNKIVKEGYSTRKWQSGIVMDSLRRGYLVIASEGDTLYQEAQRVFMGQQQADYGWFYAAPAPDEQQRARGVGIWLTKGLAWYVQHSMTIQIPGVMIAICLCMRGREIWLNNLYWLHADKYTKKSEILKKVREIHQRSRLSEVPNGQPDKNSYQPLVPGLGMVDIGATCEPMNNVSMTRVLYKGSLGQMSASRIDQIWTTSELSKKAGMYFVEKELLLGMVSDYRPVVVEFAEWASPQHKSRKKDQVLRIDEMNATVEKWKAYTEVLEEQVTELYKEVPQLVEQVDRKQTSARMDETLQFHQEAAASLETTVPSLRDAESLLAPAAQSCTREQSKAHGDWWPILWKSIKLVATGTIEMQAAAVVPETRTTIAISSIPPPCLVSSALEWMKRQFQHQGILTFQVSGQTLWRELFVVEQQLQDLIASTQRANSTPQGKVSEIETNDKKEFVIATKQAGIGSVTGMGREAIKQIGRRNIERVLGNWFGPHPGSQAQNQQMLEEIKRV
ncbi:hypothetical protein BJ742DRAFT_892171 [Cladochytrium replicatum]|nr:hypothetical protein BJ742DRAFT_892171 [Cladochytrium replicatum]